jgi:hypothetical protein
MISLNLLLHSNISYGSLNLLLYSNSSYGQFKFVIV